ncbi:NADH-quinone oxidoreductase subunit L [Candidatus Bathyarchaeota archaeon]|nr:NADH-quinone oxidoreductase subunit L [Candidatus Bathyarchaeota archaeon]
MTPLEVILEAPGAWFSWIIPIIGALLMPLLGRISNRVRDYAAVLFALGAVVSTATLIPNLFSGEYPGDIKIATWIELPGGHPIEVGVLVDPLSILICNVVAFIAFLIVVYSIGYMHGDPNLTRYWFFFLFFIGNMLLLVLSDNLLQLLVGWEGVGLCSYGLIGYYYRDEKERWLGGPPPTKMYPPSHAGMKAFVVTGIGDVFLLAAIFIIFNYAGTLNFVELIEKAPEWVGAISAIPGLLSMTAIFFLGGPIGKSAQFPLHEWLPEAMAGPTSVSALIHAATMVKAGVYLVARISPIFYIGAYSLHIEEATVYFIAIASIGAFTSFLAASQAMVALELKKVLAYSTVSQIGYMMLGLGVSGLSEGAYVAGLTGGVFHLVSHALFKAALFLCAGSVIHTVETIYMSNMGGLKRYMPITHILMLLATLSLAGIPPLSGFWSKDSIFLASLTAGTPLALTLLAVAVITAAMTLFYSIRYISMTFYGPSSKFIQNLEHGGHEEKEPGERSITGQHGPSTSGGDHGGSLIKKEIQDAESVEHHAHPVHHIHEASPVMWVPYAILVILVLAVGILGLVGLFAPRFSPEMFIEKQFEMMLEHMEIPVHMEHVEVSTKIMAVSLSAAALLMGGIFGWVFYIARKIDSWLFVSRSPILKGVHTFLWNRWYMNPSYYRVFVDGLLWMKQLLFNLVETKVIDRISGAVASAFEAASNLLYGVFEIHGMESIINQGVPSAVTAIYHKVKRVQTGLLSYNIVYLVILMIILLIGMLWMM